MYTQVLCLGAAARELDGFLLQERSQLVNLIRPSANDRSSTAGLHTDLEPLVITVAIRVLSLGDETALEEPSTITDG